VLHRWQPPNATKHGAVQAILLLLNKRNLFAGCRVLAALPTHAPASAPLPPPSLLPTHKTTHAPCPHLLEVARCAGGDVVGAVNELLGNAAAQRHSHLVLQVGARVQARLQALLRGREEGEAARGAARHDGDLGHGVILGHEGANQRVARLVVSNQPLLLLAHHSALLLGAGNDALQSVRNLVLGDLLEVAAGGQDGGLVHQVGQVGTCSPAGKGGSVRCERSTRLSQA
jgi:hypothetical protein